MIVDHITNEDLQLFKKELLKDIIRITNGEELFIEDSIAERIQLSVSVAQLAIILRALMDVGIINSNNKTAVLKSFISIIATNKREIISLESIRMKMYAVEGSTKERVKELLMDMYKIVHKY